MSTWDLRHGTSKEQCTKEYKGSGRERDGERRRTAGKCQQSWRLSTSRLWEYCINNNWGQTSSLDREAVGSCLPGGAPSAQDPGKGLQTAPEGKSGLMERRTALSSRLDQGKGTWDSESFCFSNIKQPRASQPRLYREPPRTPGSHRGEDDAIRFSVLQERNKDLPSGHITLALGSCKSLTRQKLKEGYSPDAL